jgi:hypothetical protein
MSRPALELVHRRILGFLLICWVPLVVLSVYDGHFRGGVSIPFLFDVEAQARCLVMLPLFIAAELLVHLRIRIIVPMFLERHIIAEEDRERFEELIASATRLRNSVPAEIVMLAIAFTVGYWVWSHYVKLGVADWTGDTHWTAAGYWYTFVTLPILRFLLYRWYFRLFIWGRFLWRVQQLPLHLNYFHPDRAGGLGFLSESVFAFAPVLIAQSALVSGTIANRIWHSGARLPEFEMEILGITVFLLLMVLAPLCVFASQLSLARRRARREFGTLASEYVNDFRRKWIDGENPAHEALLGSSDIQSLADLANSFEVVQQMRAAPFQLTTVVRLAVLILVPIAPLVLTMIPLEELISRAIKMAV